MKILVIGGMHGNEILGLEVVKLFQDSPMSRVDTLLANERAIEANCRFVGQDLNRSFPGDRKGTEYESRRAAEMLKLTTQYDLVLDFHNTYCPMNDCGFVGEEASGALYDIAWLLGLNKIIVADYDCINKYAPNCLSVEISMDSPDNIAKIWYERIAQLSRIKDFRVQPKIELYQFVYRMSLEDRDRLKLGQQGLEAFKKMDDSLAANMGVEAPAYPIFIGDRFTPYNYGGILKRLD